jgi:hypothetical protein
MSGSSKLLSAACVFGLLTTLVTFAPTAQTDAGIGDPVVVVLDLSGSMADRDGNGVIKIDAARRSVQNLLRSAGEGAVFGLWTYPGTSECGAGEYAITPGPIDDVSTAISLVENLAPGGSTPTGTALTAAVAGLREQGYDRATIVLVSDGESNCGPPPCPVAQKIVATTGFQVTVDTVGFQQSDAGRRELTCIASATGGTYFDASDSEKLIEHFEIIAKSRLALSVSSPSVVTLGTQATIAVTVTNPSIRQVNDVRVNLSFVADDAFSVLPAVIPPTWLLGNLPAGKSVTRNWTVSMGDVQNPNMTQAHFKVRAWGKDAEDTANDGHIAISTMLPGKGDLGALLAGVRDKGFPVVIAGDSFSAGEGAGDYLSNSSGQVDKCHRSRKTYLGSLFKDTPDQFYIVACSGAVTNHVYGQQSQNGFGSMSQEDQIREIPNPGAVLLTLGGNDLQFSDIIKSCMKESDCTTDPLLRNARVEVFSGVTAKVLPGGDIIPFVGEKLSDAYRRLWLSANGPDQVAKRGGQYAPVIVLPYPLVLHDSQFGACHPNTIGSDFVTGTLAQLSSQKFSSAEVSYLNDFENALNAKIAESVRTVVAEGYEVYFAEGAVSGAFRPEHTACASIQRSYMTPIQLLSLKPVTASQDSFHPKDDGYRATTAALMSWLGTSVELVAPNEKLIQKHLPYGVGVWNPVAALFSSGSIDFDSTRATSQLATGTDVHLHAVGFAPGAAVAILLHSSPRYLGSILADDDGVVDGVIAVPGDSAVGAHVLVAEGFGADGAYLVKHVEVSVVPQLPIGIAAAGAAGLLALLAGLVGLMIGAVRRSRTTRAGAR